MRKVIVIGLISFSLFVQTADNFGQWNDDIDAALAATGGLVQLVGDFVAGLGELDSSNEQPFAECTIL